MGKTEDKDKDSTESIREDVAIAPDSEIEGCASDEAAEQAASAEDETRPVADAGDDEKALEQTAQDADVNPADAADEEKLEEAGKASMGLEAAMQEALESVEGIRKGKKKKKKKSEDEPQAPSKKELELKMQIIDLQHKVRELEQDVEKRLKEIRQNYEEAKRISKQFEDYRMRIQREKADWFNYGHEPLIKELLPLIDNLERALEHAQKPEDFDALKEGIGLSLRQCLQTLSRFGVEQISAMGKQFDPCYHEAMSITNDSEAPSNTVVYEHQRGYIMKDRLIRPCLVTVSRRANNDDGKNENKDSQPDEEPQAENERQDNCE